jgi:hypothetical protein
LVMMRPSSMSLWSVNRVFKLSVFSRAVGFMVYNLRSYTCSSFQCHFQAPQTILDIWKTSNIPRQNFFAWLML